MSAITTTVGTLGAMPTFSSGTPEDWQLFKFQLKYFFKASEITDDDRKKAILFSVPGDYILRNTLKLRKPEVVDNMCFDDVISLLDSHITLQKTESKMRDGEMRKRHLGSNYRSSTSPKSDDTDRNSVRSLSTSSEEEKKRRDDDINRWRYLDEIRRSEEIRRRRYRSDDSERRHSEERRSLRYEDKKRLSEDRYYEYKKRRCNQDEEDYNRREHEMRTYRSNRERSFYLEKYHVQSPMVHQPPPEPRHCFYYPPPWLPPPGVWGCFPRPVRPNFQPHFNFKAAPKPVTVPKPSVTAPKPSVTAPKPVTAPVPARVPFVPARAPAHVPVPARAPPQKKIKR